MKEFMIGGTYLFHYEPKKDRKNKKDRIPVQLKEKLQDELVKDLWTKQDEIAENYKSKKADMKEYFKMLKKLEKVKSAKKKGARKSEEQLEIESAIDTLKALYFPKRKYKAKEKAINAFIRFFENDRIKLSATEEGSIKAVYAGKSISPKGNILDKWYVLSDTSVPALLYNEKYMEAV